MRLEAADWDAYEKTEYARLLRSFQACGPDALMLATENAAYWNRKYREVMEDQRNEIRQERSEVYLADVLLLCVTCRQPIKARINTAQWIRCEWISLQGECQECAQARKERDNDAGVE